MGKAVSEKNGLDFNITARSLMKYALPTLLSNVFMNIYGMVDSFFVSNYVGTDGLSALNIVWPVVMITMAVGIMISTGGSALCGKLLGEGREKKSNEIFSFLTLFSLAVSIILCILGIAFRRPLIFALGADEALYPLCEEYALFILYLLPAAMLGAVYQPFFVTAGKPNTSFALAVGGGVINIVLDWLFVAELSMGMSGAALASGIGYLFQSVMGTVYFFLFRKGTVYFVKPIWDTRALLKSLSNGMSEMVSILTGSVTMIAMNIILMKISGSDSVAACAIVLTMQALLAAVYMGYLYGVAPVISYNYGKKDEDNLKKLYRVLKRTIALLSVITGFLAFILARPMAVIFGDGNESVMDMAVKGMWVFIPGFLVMGFNIMGSSMFTALNDGKTSAIISLFRTFIFLIIPLLILPFIFGVWGVWASLPLAEILTIFLTVYFFRSKRKIFHYA